MSKGNPRYRVTLSCLGVPAEEADVAAANIAQEFKNRPWHQNVTCKCNGTTLILQAENDVDNDGLALMDEFSDVISACIKNSFDGNVEILSIEMLTGD